LMSTAATAARKVAEEGSEVGGVAGVSSTVGGGWETFEGDPEGGVVRNSRRFVVQSINGLC
jgi:hypothetical protein